MPLQTYNQKNRRQAAAFERLRDQLSSGTSSLEGGAAAVAVRRIVADVKRRGAAAVTAYTKKYDGIALNQQRLRLTDSQINAGFQRTDRTVRGALKKAIANVRAFQKKTLLKDPTPLRQPGITLALRYTPIDRVGLYVPGGAASYPSTLVMLAVPAQIAGVRQIALCCPAGREGKINDAVLAVAHLLKLDEIYPIGGAQSVAAMAYGAGMKGVDFIAGPGNVYVQLAKAIVSPVVGIDSFAGPSEIVLIADRWAKPGFLAADMLAQAEHSPGAAILLTDSAQLAVKVANEIDVQLVSSGRRKQLEKTLQKWSAICVMPSIAAAIEMSNSIAPEHLSIQCRGARRVAARCRHSGATFIGPYSPVAVGDYWAGPSHCLPTAATARYCAGVTANTFRKSSSIIEYNKRALARAAGGIRTLAAAESLDAHAASIKVREKAKGGR